MINETHAAMLRRAERVPLYSAGSRLTERNTDYLVERGFLAPTESRFLFEITDAGREALKEFEDAFAEA